MFGLGVPGGAGCTPLGSTLAAGQTLATAVTDPPSTCTTSTSIPATTSSTPVTSTSSTQSSGTVTSTPTALTTTQGSGNNGVGSSSNSNKASGHLNGGAIAGIAIGAIAGVALALLAALWIARRTRRARREAEWTGVPQDLPPKPQSPRFQAGLGGNSHAELEAKGLAGTAQLSELAS
jgi:hypothetical protein